MPMSKSQVNGYNGEGQQSFLGSLNEAPHSYFTISHFSLGSSLNCRPEQQLCRKTQIFGELALHRALNLHCKLGTVQVGWIQGQCSDHSSWRHTILS